MEHKSTADYYKRIKGLSLDELKDIEKNIDREKYSDRYDTAKELIEIKKELSPSIDISTDLEKNFPKGVKFIENAYLIYIIIFVFGLVYKIAFKDSDNTVLPGVIIHLFVIATIYYGITMIKQWVVVLIKLYAYMSLLHVMFSFAENHSDMISLLTNRTLSLLFLCFLIYQIFVFSKKETKLFFNDMWSYDCLKQPILKFH